MAGPSPFEPVTEAIHSHMDNWDANSATEVVEALEGIGEVGAALTAAMHKIGERLIEDRPRLHGVWDALRILAGMTSPMQGLTEEVVANFKDENKFWLKSEED